jgi:hypothetical protein
MSMYTQLLQAALDNTGRAQVVPSPKEALVALRRCRRHLDANPGGPSGDDWAPLAVADQLAYDVALIELTRSLGVDYDLQAFEHPQKARARLEQDLEARGIPIDPADEHGHPGQRHATR